MLHLIGRIPDLGAVTWLTYDRGLTHDTLVAAGRADDRVVFAPYAAPRDLVNLARNARVAGRVLARVRPDLVVSTGAGIAVATLPLARLRGIRACYIESATRGEGPSMSGRILERVPGIELYTQNAGPGFGRRWRHIGSVYDAFRAVPAREPARIRRVVVTVGTIQPYGFERLVHALLDLLPNHAEVLWQTGATDVSALPIDARETVPGPEIKAAMREADVIVSHAGVGSALTAFEVGKVPVLVPRRAVAGEHVDDHQAITAEDLHARGLAIHAEADRLRLDHLERAASVEVEPLDEPPPLAL
jgi:UDP-N-acetylglucosamine--N-acetylmuramyl-(pentapeptide) pyrophosphoryl-undecaprenol N-acetylglucosamine transferase